MPITDLQQAYKILKSYVPAKSPDGYSLDTMLAMMSALGNPQNNYKVVHVAGTSGKTSTAYYIADMLRRAGAKVGLTVSPHVTEVNERVQINGLSLAEAKFCSELDIFLKIINKLSINPSYYELLVAFAFWEFDRQNVDYAVVEVGLGGLLDGTNVIDRADKLCVITDIGLDHVRLLGNTLPEITTQKAGIIQPNNCVVCYRQGPEVYDVIQRVCKQKQAILKLADEPILDSVSTMPLFQQRNWNLAKTVFDIVAERDGLVSLNEQDTKDSQQLLVPGRMEIIKLGNKTLVMDGAHNGQKMATLAKSLSARFPNTKFNVVLGISAANDQKTDQIISELLPITNRLIITAFRANQDEPKATANLNGIVAGCKAYGFANFITARSVESAYAELISADNYLLVTGSLYLINAIRPLVLAQHATVNA